MTYAEYCATKGIAPKPYLDEQRDQFEQFLNEKYDAAFNEGTYLHKCLEQASLRSAELERENAELRKDKATLKNCLRAALDWIDAVPKDITLPAMPGFDRDWVNDAMQSAGEQK